MYPYVSSLIGISFYSATQTSDAVYVIGGRFTNNIVAEFKNDQWRRLGFLNQPREGHGSITVDGQTMIIGGVEYDHYIPMVTEVWELENGNNKISEPTLPYFFSYLYGMALYIVDKDFCKK